MYAAVYAPGNLPVLLDCARQFSPLIEVSSPDVVTFDIRGLGRSIGTVDQIAKAIERTVGIPAQIAIAANPDTANILARSTAAVTVVPVGGEAERLAQLSLLYLGCPAEMGEVLEVWGVRTFGQFAELPPLGVAARLGEEGVYWQQQARGTYHRQLRILHDQARYYREHDLEEPVTNLEPLLFLVGRSLFELCLELDARTLATNEIRLDLDLENRQQHSIALRLPVPMRDRKALLKLVQLELDRTPPPAPVVKLVLELMPVTPKTTQEDLFTAAYPAPEQIELTLARVRQIVGAENIGSPELLNSHMPDGFTMRSFVASAKTSATSAYGEVALAFRRFRPPEPAQVKLAQQPVFVACRVVRGAVRTARGPWFTSGHWWAKDVWSHEEWDVALQNEAVFRIFRDLRTEAWFVEGNYD